MPDEAAARRESVRFAFLATKSAAASRTVGLKLKGVQSVYFDMDRILGISAAASGVFGVALVLLLPLSYHPKQDPFEPGVAIAPRFHVGVHNGAVCIYSDLAFGGGTTSISRDDGSVDPVLDFPGGCYFAFCGPTGTVWSLNMSLLFPIVACATLPIVSQYRFRRGRTTSLLQALAGLRPCSMGHARPALAERRR